ncbi:MAG: ABC transporter substrate-binding protein [Clostridiales bacterium]|nr:ABC transporter substrate-binding protein [Clostridiales bacterium]
MKKRLISMVLAAAMVGTMMTGCGNSSSAAPSDAAQTETSGNEGTIRISQSPGGVIDPGVGIDCTSAISYVNMYSSLVVPNLDNEPEASLAESWDISDDGLVYTFKMKEAKFHDGSDVLASDVVFSMNRLLTMGEGFGYLFATCVDEAVAVDDHTVEIRLKNAFAPFLSIVPRCYILNEDLVMENIQEGSYGEYGDYGKAYLAEHDAGSGAYYLSDIKTGSSYTMTLFEDYFEEVNEKAPKVVEVVQNTETAAIRTMMNNGELQISDQWQTNEAYNALDNIEGVDVGSNPSGQILYLMVNTKKAPTDDVHVRRALAYMIDYDQVVNTLFPGFQKATSSVPASAFGYSDAGFDYEFDLEKAQSELEQSQYYDQLKSGELQIEFEWNSDVPDQEKVALLVQATASQLGIGIKVIKAPWATHVENCGSIETTSNTGLCFGAGDYPEAGAYLYQRFSSDTAGTWQQMEWLQDPVLDEKISTALTTIDDDERSALYAEIQQEVSENCYGIPIAEQIEKHAYFDNITIPAIESAEAGGSSCILLGYNYTFKDFIVE